MGSAEEFPRPQWEELARGIADVIRRRGPEEGLLAAFRRLDEITAGLDREAHASLGFEATACARRCGHCCRLPVLVSPVEAVIILRTLRRRVSASEFRRMAARIREVARATEGLQDPARIIRDIACPLLVNEECSVYDVRPLGCHSHTSIDSALCAAGRGRPEASRAMSLEHARGGALALGALLTALAERGARPLMIELTAGLEHALDSPALLRDLMRGAGVPGSHELEWIDALVASLGKDAGGRKEGHHE